MAGDSSRDGAAAVSTCHSHGIQELRFPHPKIKDRACKSRREHCLAFSVIALLALLQIGLIVSVVCCATGALSLAVEWSACAVTSAALPAGSGDSRDQLLYHSRCIICGFSSFRSVYIVSGSCAGFKSEPLASGNHVWAMGLALAMLLSGIEVCFVCSYHSQCHSCPELQVITPVQTLRYISAAKAIAVQSTVCVLTFSLPGESYLSHAFFATCSYRDLESCVHHTTCLSQIPFALLSNTSSRPVCLSYSLTCRAL